MAINIGKVKEALTEGNWRAWPEDRSADPERYKIRPLFPEAADRIAARASGSVSAFVDKTQDSADRERYLAHLTEHLIEDWEGILGDDGGKLPVTGENRLKIVKLLPGRLDWILERSKGDARRIAAAEEESEKN